MRLSKNFSLKELTKSNTATRLGIDNTPTEEHIANLKKLCENVLQPLRDAIGLPIRITSGYRSEALNNAIGGSKTSDHSHGRAADIELIVEVHDENGRHTEEDNATLFDTIKELNLPYYQLIWEFGNDNQPNWVHVAYREQDPKQQDLKAVKIEGKTKYILL
jgi:hypothetical protein